MTQIEKKYFDYNALPDNKARAFVRKRQDFIVAEMKRTAIGVWNIGKAIAEVKGVLQQEGQFMNWIEGNLGLSYFSARNFVNVFEKFPNLPQSLNNSNSNIAPTVLYTLAESNVSDATRAVAVEQIKTGELKNVAETKSLVQSIERAVEVSKFVHLFHTCGLRHDHPDAALLPEYSEEDLIDIFGTGSTGQPVGLDDLMIGLTAWETFHDIYPRWEFLNSDWSAGSEMESQYGAMTERRRDFETTQLHLICKRAWKAAPMEKFWPVFQDLTKRLQTRRSGDYPQYGYPDVSAGLATA